VSDSGDVFDFLSEQFALVNDKLDRLGADVHNLKICMSALESESGFIRVALGELNGRVDRIEGRLDRIERRLDLADAET
jgi:hypothetical protein